jgi:hypothetical protein
VMCDLENLEGVVRAPDLIPELPTSKKNFT